MIQINRRLLYIDLAFCLLLVPFMIWLLPVNRWMNNNASFVFLFVGWLYVVYFVNRYCTIPWIFRNRAHLIGALVMVLMTVVVTYLISCYRFETPQFLPRRPHLLHGETGSQSRMEINLHQRAVWFLYVVVLAFSFAVGVLAELYRLVMERQIVEHEKKKAELALYKVQINPHFLFNTLNTLYGLMLTDIGRAETAFMQFMDMLKYMYTSAEKDKVPLQAEIDYIRKYIELQKNRMNEHTRVHFSFESRNENPDLMIAPMILITFVENAFKYGVSSHEDTDIYVTVGIDGTCFRFSTQNSIISLPEKEKSGYGIANCRKRLELLYPDRYQLEITEQGDCYRVTLILHLR